MNEQKKIDENQDFLQSAAGRKLERRYLALKEKICALGWLTHGSVTPNHPGHWKWTTKVDSKTVTLAVSQEQARLFQEAIVNHRKLESIIREMRSISREVLLKSAPGTRRRKTIPRLA